MMPARNIFSDLYQSSGGRLRQTREMRPTDITVDPVRPVFHMFK